MLRKVRKFEGKLDRHGLDTRLLSTVKLMNDKERSRRHARGTAGTNFFGGGGASTAPAAISFSNVHLAAIRFAQRTDLFSVGKPLRDWKLNGPCGAALPSGVPVSAPVKGAPVPVAPSFLTLLSTGEERLRRSVETHYLPTRSRLVSRPEESTGAFRTVKALHPDTLKEQHFRWGKLWSTSAAEIDTLKDGTEAMVTSDMARAELLRYAAQHCATRQAQAAALAAATAGGRPPPAAAEQWALQLLTDSAVKALKSKATLARALAAARQLVFRHVRQPPPDPSLAAGRVQWGEAEAMAVLQHPLLGGDGSSGAGGGGGGGGSGGGGGGSGSVIR